MNYMYYVQYVDVYLTLRYNIELVCLTLTPDSHVVWFVTMRRIAVSGIGQGELSVVKDEATTCSCTGIFGLRDTLHQKTCVLD